MKKLCLWILCLSLLSQGAFAGLPSYEVERHDSKEWTWLRAYDARTGKTIWSHSFFNVTEIAWSKNHRNLAIIDDSDAKHQFEGNRRGFNLVVWRAGERLRSFSGPPYMQEGYIEYLLWSPANNFLLIGSGTSGDSTMNFGKLWCLNLNTGKAHVISRYATNPKWHKEGEVVYWKMIFFKDKQGNPDYQPSDRLYRYRCY